ncbi:E3 ubiquitin-protein ligase RNF4 [Neltuma alba]|uniref:E3 ubiquitin-protein ligase RNF4 n=1 Tax=Neltuma alba TaxID=207710 RepID=UPI0010A3112F|nr:E3 ubiquitin-protein ligase RNF4-like [Prosopis alba]XP_028765263.1 E3 ubiquitin-protein ligase RNF4-like [Prosopis alba]
MSTQTVRGPAVRSGRRRKTVLNLDLNCFPPSENQEQGGPSTQLVPREVQAGQQLPVAQPVMIDVEAIEDDDVVESSPRAFAEAKNNFRRNRRRTIVDVDLEERTGGINNDRNKRKRSSSNRTIINCDLYVNLEASNSSMTENIRMPPEPPKDPVFNCPICMGPLVEEMSTRCGHIFCNNCIRAAIKVQSKCPTCRKKVTVKELRRVFLPATG